MWKSIAVLLFSTSLFGEDLALARLKHEMAVAREQAEHVQQFGENGAARIEAVHAALRDWFEPRLPKDIHFLAGDASLLGASLQKQLVDAGLSKPESADPDPNVIDPAFDHVSDPAFDEVELELKMMPELPETLFVTAYVGVPCGSDAAVYAYRFDSNGRARVIEDHPKSDWGYGATIKLSDPDLQGRRLLLIHRGSVQCASSWMGMKYAVYRMSLSQAPESLISSEHGFWLDDGPEFILKPDELMIEFLDRSVDGGVHNRTHLFRYNFAEGVKRIEPMAFQPQDFAEEWMTRPWSEMQSRSTPGAQKWHAKLHADFVLGEYTNMVLCNAKADRWSIGLEIEYIGENKLKEPIRAHFLVRDLGNYRFEMEAVSDSEFEGCPGTGSPSDKHPWLSAEQLKALP